VVPVNHSPLVHDAGRAPHFVSRRIPDELVAFWKCVVGVLRPPGVGDDPCRA
jgi:hypothetical protein